MTTWIDADYRGGRLPTGAQVGELWTAVQPTAAEGGTGSAAVRVLHVATPTIRPREMTERVRKALDDGAPPVIRLSPGRVGHRYPLEDWALAPLPALCEREGWALAVDYGADADARLGELACFAGSAPEVAVLLLGNLVDELSGVWRLLDRCPNVLVQLLPGVEAAVCVAACNEFGAHRFVYGSGGRAAGPIETLAESLDELTRTAVFADNARLLDDCSWRDTYL
jgi:hypothetical protein